MLSRRVILRTLLALPILLCLAGWLWSSRHETGVAYGSGDRGVSLGSWAGALRLEWGVGSVGPGSVWVNQPRNPSKFWPSKEGRDETWFLGFSYRYYRWTSRDYFHNFAVPYWFLIVVSGGVFAWVWRKTGRKPDPKTAFPVEVAARGGAKDAGPREPGA